MTGQQLSTTRKLNAHWQSGTQKGIDLLKINTFPKPRTISPYSSIYQTPIKTVLPFGVSSDTGYRYFLYFPGTVTPMGSPAGREKATAHAALVSNNQISNIFYYTKYIKLNYPEIEPKAWYAKTTLLSKPNEWKNIPLYINRAVKWRFLYYQTDSSKYPTSQVITGNSNIISAENITGIPTNESGYTRLDINAPIIDKCDIVTPGYLTFTNTGKRPIEGICIEWPGLSEIEIFPEPYESASQNLTGKFLIKYELLTESEYNA